MESDFVINIGMGIFLVMATALTIFIIYYRQRQTHQQLIIKELQEQHRRELMTATFQGQEEERKRLAEDLHDGIGTMLSVTKMSLNQLEKRLADNDEQINSHLQKTRLMIDETMTNVRRISRELVPTTLERFGLIPALEELADRANGNEIKVQLDCPDHANQFPSTVSLTLYRIAQELISNAIRHARAHYIIIQLHCLSDTVRLSVLDDGVGFDFDTIMEKNQGGLGLRNIESRLSVINGYVTFDVAPGRGSQIHVQIHLPDPLLRS